MLSSLKFIKLRFSFTAKEKILFPKNLKGNIFRGAFGIVLKNFQSRVSENLENSDFLKIYNNFFTPYDSSAPSGIKNLPRPFVIDPMEDREIIYPGESFSLGLTVFGNAINYIPYVINVFKELEELGIGPTRGKFLIRNILREDLDGSLYPVFSEDGTLLELKPFCLNFDADISSSIFKITFLTPTKLIYEEKPVKEPEFIHIFSRIKDRISAIAYFYNGVELQENYLALKEEAKNIEILESNWRWVEVKRRSSKTKQIHDLSGVIGSAVFDAKDTERLSFFFPWLKIAELVNVGKNAVWGMGKMKTQFNLQKKLIYVSEKEINYVRK